MSKNNPRTIHLKDYRVPPFLIERTALHFELGEKATLVKSRLSMRRNPASEEQAAPLALHGDGSLELRRLVVDGRDLAASEYELGEQGLVIPGAFTAPFELECVTLIKPQENTSLEGLYKSNGMFCTQCEAEGFRKITYYLDRPDVMSIFTTTVVADQVEYPVLLSNGNPVAQGEQDGRHWVTWEDPFAKPAYLFALVAGKLAVVEDSFTTCSGREIALRLFVEPQNLDKCEHAIRSLQKAMRWDEEVYGREYDLDIFMIVAVDHFNMGAMENKGLNIFNSSCVLAKPETTTDSSFERIEGIVAHEYFHNWSGNRVTCRDWFQLSLKEGFTVFRDAEFTADMGSRTVKRIDDVALLRTQQFAEDAGPMAHPIRPASFIEISNFYTLTVYEKGAEVVRMLHTLLGADKFREGSDLYFARFDGQAVTTDDFVACMAEVSGLDLTQFKHWYSQAGTPRVEVEDHYDADSGRYTLTLSQSCPPTPECSDKQPFVIPVALGLLDEAGNDLPLGQGQTTQVLRLEQAQQTFVFEQIPCRPVPSLLRGFSAPVILRYPYSRDQLMFLMAHDSDGFNRWDAGQQLAVQIIQGLISDYQVGRELLLDERLEQAYRLVLADDELDEAMVAKMLTLPSEAYLAQLADEIDVDAIHAVRNFVRRTLAERLAEPLQATYQRNRSQGEFELSAEAVAQRALQNQALLYLMALERPQDIALAQQQLAEANNMTDALAALTALANCDDDSARETALASFYSRWQNDTLVVNQWLSVQASADRPDCFARVQQLLQHPAFDAANPNKIRALIGVFCGQNAVHFHRPDGEGYRFLADQVLALDARNPQIASRLLGPLTRWKRYDAKRRGLMQAQLERIQAATKLSPDTYEVVTKTLV